MSRVFEYNKTDTKSTVNDMKTCVYKQQLVTNNEYNFGCCCASFLCNKKTCVGARGCQHAFIIAVDAEYAKHKAKQCSACLKKTREETQKQR